MLTHGSKSPRSYTLLFARKGKTPVRIVIHPVPALLGAFVALATPLACVGQMLYSLHQQNRVLTQSATQVLKELEVLDQEVEELRKRAGLPQSRLHSAPPQILGGQGGLGLPLKAQQQWQVAKQQLPILSQRLQNQVKPALEGTLKKEAARQAAYPQGKPTQGMTPISSDFGPRPGPFGGSSEFHEGIDLIGPHGTPIYATASGVVERAENSGGYGNHVVIEHGYGYQTLYAHLSEITVSKGDKVQRGQMIAFMGNTGRSTGTHLHYSIYYQGKAIDPKPYMVSSPAIAQR